MLVQPNLPMANSFFIYMYVDPRGSEPFLVIAELRPRDEVWSVEEQEHEVEGCDINKDRLTSSQEL